VTDSWSCIFTRWST